MIKGTFWINNAQDGRTSIGIEDYDVEMFDGMDVVTRDMYEEKFPIYSSIFSWDEFVENECRWGDDRIAVKEG